MLSIYRISGKSREANGLKLRRTCEAGVFYHTGTQLNQRPEQSTPVSVNQQANSEAKDANVLLSADMT